MAVQQLRVASRWVAIGRICVAVKIKLIENGSDLMAGGKFLYFACDEMTIPWMQMFRSTVNATAQSNMPVLCTNVSPSTRLWQ
jgi:hypothetical protein